MKKGKEKTPKRETSLKKRYKKPVLKRMDVKINTVGFSQSTLPTG